MLFPSRFRLSAVTIAISCLPVFAQTTADISAERQIETITVRGEKTDRSIQDTTSSVAVTTALKIEQENLQSLDDILNRTANVSAMYGSRGFTIRGIADEAGASNPLATIYLDGAALPSQISDSGPPANGETPASTRDFDAFLPKLGVRWEYAAQQSLAFTVQRGYRSGGSSFNIARSEIFAYDPEFTTNYELSWRGSWPEQSLQLSSNLYYIDWKDKQVIANFGANTYDYHTVNASKRRALRQDNSIWAKTA